MAFLGLLTGFTAGEGLLPIRSFAADFSLKNVKKRGNFVATLCKRLRPISEIPTWCRRAPKCSIRKPLNSWKIGPPRRCYMRA
jgi:hypothetical protein